MPAQIDADRLLLEGEKIFLPEFIDLRQRCPEALARLLAEEVKERNLPRNRILLLCLLVEQFGNQQEFLPAVSRHRIQRPGLHKALERAPVRLLVGESLDKIFERAERAARLPLPHNLLAHAGADRADCREAEADAVPRDREHRLPVVHIRRQNRNAHLAADQNVLGNLVAVVNDRSHERRHEFLRVVVL